MLGAAEGKGLVSRTGSLTHDQHEEQEDQDEGKALQDHDPPLDPFVLLDFGGNLVLQEHLFGGRLDFPSEGRLEVLGLAGLGLAEGAGDLVSLEGGRRDAAVTDGLDEVAVLEILGRRVGLHGIEDHEHGHAQGDDQHQLSQWLRQPKIPLFNAVPPCPGGTPGCLGRGLPSAARDPCLMGAGEQQPSPPGRLRSGGAVGGFASRAAPS